MADVHKASEALVAKVESLVGELGSVVPTYLIMAEVTALRAALAAEPENVAAERLEGEPSDRALRMQWRARQVKLTDLPETRVAKCGSGVEAGQSIPEHQPTVEKPTPVCDCERTGASECSVCNPGLMAELMSPPTGPFPEKPTPEPDAIEDAKALSDQLRFYAASPDRAGVLRREGEKHIAQALTYYRAAPEPTTKCDYCTSPAIETVLDHVVGARLSYCPEHDPRSPSHDG